MRIDTFVDQIAAVGVHAIHFAPFLIGAYIVWRHQTSRSAPIAAVR